MHDKPTLTYFDFHGGRGEDCRLALFIAGVAFNDDRVKGADWKQRKASTPFGSIPVFQLPGRDGQLGQSNAILRLIGRGHGLHPEDLWEAAHHDALMDVAEELRQVVGATLRIQDEDEKKRARGDLATGLIQQWATNVSKQITGPLISGDDLHVADLKLYVLLNWFISGSLDHIPADVFKNHPRLTGLHAAVKNHPKVVEYYAQW